MCYYRLYIFMGCGHSTSSSMPVKHCASATNSDIPEVSSSTGPPEGCSVATVESIEDHDMASPTSLTTGSRKSLFAMHLSQASPSRERIIPKSNKTTLQPCEEGRIHPLHTVRLDRICADCVFERDRRLQNLDWASTEMRIQPKGRQGHYRGKSQRLPPKSERVAGADEHTAEVGWNLLGHRKVDSGVWTVGARWLRDWKGAE
jgi:hypothetical protein